MLLDFDTYSVDVTREEVAVLLDGRRYAILNVSSPVNTPEGLDVDYPLPEPDYMRYEDGVNMNWTARSNLWSQKIYSWHFEHDLFWCQVKIKGFGPIHDLHYFEGSYADFSQFIADRCDESSRFKCADSSAAEQVLPPLCCCFGFETGPWLGAGVAPEKGVCDFTLFEYVPGMDSLCFRLEYAGRVQADGSWSSPFFIFRPGATAQDAVAKYCDVLKAWMAS